MILWLDGAHDAASNMRRDAVLLERAESGRGREAVLRLFRFEPHGITLGASQDPARVLDLEACAAAGVTWAHRPTGGRAIFHAEEWTYSLTARIDDPEWGGSLHAAYAAVSRLLVASLLRLDVPVEAGGTDARGRPGDSAACFASTLGHEIALEGGKLVGSAQRRLSVALLQQGSLLLGDGHLRLAELVAGTAEVRRRLREELRRKTTNAGRWLGAAPLERWRDAIAESLPVRPSPLEGEAGARALTLPEAASYTPTVPPSPVAPSRRAP